MTPNFVLSVYRQHSNGELRMQHFNFTDMLEACRKASALKAERWVRKVELSVIIHTWQ